MHGTAFLRFTLAFLLLLPGIATAQSDTGRRITTAPVRLVNDVVDFGDVKPGTTVTRTATILNESDEPIRIRGVRVSCGCTIADWPEDWIEPGQSVEVELTFDSGELWGPVQRYALLQFEGFNRPLRITTTAHVNTGIRASRMYLPPGQMMQGKLTLRSTDGAAFRVLGMSFATATDDREGTQGALSRDDLDPSLSEPALEHTVEFDFSRVDPEHLRRWVAIATDHPTAPVIAMHIDNPYAGIDRRRTLWVFAKDHELLGSASRGETITRTVTLRGLRAEVPIQSFAFESDLLRGEVVSTSFDPVEGLRIEYRLTVDEEAQGLIHTRLTARAIDFEDSVEVMLMVRDQQSGTPEPEADAGSDGAEPRP